MLLTDLELHADPETPMAIFPLYSLELRTLKPPASSSYSQVETAELLKYFSIFLRSINFSIAYDRPVSFSSTFYKHAIHCPSDGINWELNHQH